MEQHPSAFEVLWQAEDGLGLTKGLEAFEQAFESIQQPERTVKFLNNLLTAVQQVSALPADLQDVQFLDLPITHYPSPITHHPFPTRKRTMSQKVRSRFPKWAF